MYRLLIVDDEALTREFIKTQLHSIDGNWYAEGEARDGEEALEFLKNHTVDLVVTDIKMPAMDGLELCEKIAKNNAAQEIVILSGYDEFAYAQKAMRYQVGGYLLKPIRIPDLKKTLAEVSVRLQRRKNKEISFQAMKSLSVDYQTHVCRSYLKAIIENSYTDIQALHPIVHKLKIDFMQAQGILLVLRLDIDRMILQRIPIGDLTIFRFVLYQITTEITTDMQDEGSYVLLDSHENTVLYLTGDTDSQLVQKCEKSYHKISSFFADQTQLTITGFIGSSKSDILEMYASYQDAYQQFPLWAIEKGATLYDCRSADSSVLARIHALNDKLSAAVTGLMETSDQKLRFGIDDILKDMPDFAAARAVRYLLLLLETVRIFKPEFDSERYLLCLKQISDLFTKATRSYSKDELFQIYISVLRTAWGFSSPEMEGKSIQTLVESSKNYIYQHFSEPITLSQIADVLHVSPNYLSRIFHETVGESYIKFITRVRMEYAANLLRTTNERIFTIAEKTGYYNLKHFNFVFKEYYHMTPTEYQKDS